MVEVCRVVNPVVDSTRDLILIFTEKMGTGFEAGEITVTAVEDRK